MERQRGGGGSYCKARQRGKALQQAEWKDRLSFDGSLNLYQTFCQHPLHASEPNALTEWLNFLPVSFSPSSFTQSSLSTPSLLSLCLDLHGFIHFPICQRVENSSCLRVLMKTTQTCVIYRSLRPCFPRKPRASFTAKDTEKRRGGLVWIYVPSLSGLIFL